jgi:hypothetical protein
MGLSPPSKRDLSLRAADRVGLGEKGVSPKAQVFSSCSSAFVAYLHDRRLGPLEKARSLVRKGWPSS